MSHLDQAKARQANPATLIQAGHRADKIFARLKAANINTMAIALQEAPHVRAKTIWLKQIMTALDKATAGLVPCKAGCSHCCYMAVNVTYQEAEAISKATGKPLQALGHDSDKTTDEENIKRYEGTPCPFLVDNQCSIYDVRPFSCRAHYSVDSDNLLCKIVPGETIRTPTLNTLQFTALHLLSYGDPLIVRYADIREFFNHN